MPPQYRGGTSAAENRKYQQDRFGDARLPLYVILKPDGGDGQEISRYDEGKINSVEEFVNFLKQPLESKGEAAGSGSGRQNDEEPDYPRSRGAE